MIPATIISAVRERLGDTKNERWDTATLMLYVSLCQNDICMFTQMYRRQSTIQLLDNQYIYELPTDFMVLSRLEYRDKVFPVETRADIDRGEVVFPLALKDNLLYNELEIQIGEGYDDLRTALVNVYGVVVASDTDDIAVDCELEDIHGVVVDAEPDSTEPPIQPLDQLLVYYVAVPPILNVGDVTKTLEVPDIWFQAFLHYVCGMALQDDNDANNIQRGELEAQKYTRLLQHIHATSMKDFTGNEGKRLTTTYRRT